MAYRNVRTQTIKTDTIFERISCESREGKVCVCVFAIVCECVREALALERDCIRQDKFDEERVGTGLKKKKWYCFIEDRKA